MQTKILTLDAGTTGLKCTLFSKDGCALASFVSAYSVDFPRVDWAEQPCDRFFYAAKEAVRAVTLEAGSEGIAAIGLSGTMNGCVPIDAAGHALYPNIIHADTRATRQLEAIRAVASEAEYYARTGNRIDVHYSLPKILWLKENLPDVYQRARYFINTKDALYTFLTGRIGYTDYSDASLTGALHLKKREWDFALLGDLGIDAKKMPRLCVAHAAEGRLTKESAALLGLAEGIPVVMGAGDGTCAAHGAGIFGENGAYANIGSSAWLSALSREQIIDPERRVFNYIDMDGVHFDVCGTVQSGAAAFDWAISNILKVTDYAQLERLAAKSPPGARGVFFLPTLMGERTPWWNPSARGTLIGFSLHHGPQDIARAVYEGIAQALHLCARVLKQGGVAFDELMLIGGGAASGVWPQMLADMLGVTAKVHAHPRSATSLGAAMAAGVGVGIFKDYQEAAQMAQHEKTFPCQKENNAAYEKHFALYESLYPRLKTAYEDIAAFQAAYEGEG